MPRTYDTLTLEDAKRMLAAAEVKAASLGIPYNLAVVDAGGHLVAFLRQDGALIGSIDSRHPQGGDGENLRQNNVYSSEARAVGRSTLRHSGK